MRKAFQKGGRLADATALEAEQEALAHLFAGAIGSYKNPHSHRSVTIESTEAAEMIVLAPRQEHIPHPQGAEAVPWERR